MANRRTIKKNINHLIGDVIEEYYNALLNGDGKNEKQIESEVDKCVDLADELIAKVNSSKKLKTRAEVKKMFAELKDKLGDNVLASIEKIDSM